MRGEGYFVTVYERRIYSALRNDVDHLAKKFCEQDSLDIDKFIDLFISAEFSTIFIGRLSISELAEFSENLLLYCARYMFSNVFENDRPLANYCIGGKANKAHEISRLKIDCERSLNERIFGIYMVYCMYFLQSAQYVFPIRVSVLQMNNLYEFMTQTLMPDEHFFALFCIYRLVDSGAFTLTPLETDMNSLLSRRFDSFQDEEGAMDMHEIDKIKDFDLLTELSEDVTLKQLENIHSAYKRMKEKCQIPGVMNVDTDISNYVTELLSNVKKAYKKKN